MPRFVLEHVVVTADQRQLLTKLAAERFPEIDVEAQERATDGEGERWTCRSTSAVEVAAWLDGGGVQGVRIDGPAPEPGAHRDRAEQEVAR